MAGALTFAWVPGWIDTLVPFGLGAVEVAMASAAASSLPSFLFLCPPFAIAGCLAYQNYLNQIRRSDDPVSLARQSLFGRHILLGYLVIFSAIPYYAVLIYVSTVLGPERSPWLGVLLGSSAAAPMVLLAVRAQATWTYVLRVDAEQDGDG
ncbi:MAG: hypothetical protein R2878_02695 [Thermoleophilia bacterium]